jgi:hypothetical protein
MTLFPDEQLGIFIATTGDDKDELFRISLSSYIADLYNEEDPWLNSTLLCSFPQPFMAEKKKKKSRFIPQNISLDRPIEDYIGTYYNDIFHEITVTEVNNQLRMTYGYITYDLVKRRKKSEKFYMIALGHAQHVLKKRTLEFRETEANRTGYINVLHINSFEDSDFVKISEMDTSAIIPVKI